MTWAKLLTGNEMQNYRNRVLHNCPRPDHYCDGSPIKLGGIKKGKCKFRIKGICILLERDEGE